MHAILDVQLHTFHHYPFIPALPATSRQCSLYPRFSNTGGQVVLTPTLSSTTPSKTLQATIARSGTLRSPRLLPDISWSLRTRYSSSSLRSCASNGGHAESIVGNVELAEIIRFLELHYWRQKAPVELHHDTLWVYTGRDHVSWAMANTFLPDIYMISLAIFGSIVLYPGGNMAYIDALFLASGSATQSGLNTYVEASTKAC